MTAPSICNAARTTCISSECSAFRFEGQYIANWMRAQAEVKEESITDSYLYRLAQSVPTIRYISFSRWDEARRTGADWEWWFLFPTRALRLRVQAKKVRVGKSCRGDLERKNKHGGQLAMLLKSARRDRAIPVYAFYSSDATAPTACGPMSVRSGSFLAHAKGVQRLVRQRAKIFEPALLAISRPAACLPCCILRPTPVKQTINVARWLDPQDTTQRDSFEEGDEGWHDTLPDYVRGMIGTEYAIGGRWDEWASEFPPDIGAILAVDLRSAGGDAQ